MLGQSSSSVAANGGFAVTESSDRLAITITSSAGLKTAKNTWGQPAEWCDTSGTVEGRHLGIMLMADPTNFRPSWWHNRDYGLTVANPFGRAAMRQGEKSVVNVKRGESFRLRFAAAIRAGVDPTAAAAWYARSVLADAK